MLSGKKMNIVILFILVISLALCALIFTLLTRSLKPQGRGIERAEVKKIEGAAPHSFAPGKHPAISSADRVFAGNEGALTVFVYEDYSSVYSASLADTLDKIYQSASGRLNLVVRPYIAPDSLPALKAASLIDCAGSQWVKARALVFAQLKNGQFSPEELSSYAKQIGLDEAGLSACLTNSQKSEKIREASAKEASEYGINGAPTMFVGDEMIVGARPYDDFVDSNGDKIEGLKSVVDRQLQK